MEIEELEKVYNNLADEKNNIYTKNQKITLLNLLKKELKNISCYNLEGANCFYSFLNCIDDSIKEKEYVCDKLDFYLYSYEDDGIEKYRYHSCPFVKLENNVNILLKRLKEQNK